MTPQEEYNELMRMLEPHKRTAYRPVVEERKATFSVQSKIGGFPYLRHKDDWPVCPNCTRNMQLFLQLNCNELPVKKEDALVQLFYCTSGEPCCDAELEAFIPFSEATECRRIMVEGKPVRVEPIMESLFEERVIVGWIEAEDYPSPEEYEELGIVADLSDDVYEFLEAKGFPLAGDKLFGWPYWIQGVEYPFDRQTNVRMELLFQLDSEDNLPYMFGDVGIGHLTQSPDNSDELGFGWACS